MPEFNKINNSIYWDVKTTAQYWTSKNKNNYTLKGYRTINKFILDFLNDNQDTLGIDIIIDYQGKSKYSYPQVEFSLQPNSSFNINYLNEIVNQPFNVIQSKDMEFIDNEDFDNKTLEAKIKIDNYYDKFLLAYGLGQTLPEQKSKNKIMKI